MTDDKEGRRLRADPLCAGLERFLRFPVNQIVNDNEIPRTACADVVDSCAQGACAQGDANARDDRVRVSDAQERQAGGVRPDRSWKFPEAGAVLSEELDRGLVGDIDIAEDDADSA